MASNNFKLTHTVIKKNIEGLQAFMKKEGLELFYISSFDPFISEYVPLEENHRYYFTGFTGSVAQVLVPQSGKVKVYVDGRYHEQVDLEIDSTTVEAVKVPHNMSLTEAMIEDIKSIGPKTLAIEGDLTPLSLEKNLGKLAPLKVYDHQELKQIITFAPQMTLPEVEFVEKAYRGRDVKEKLDLVVENPKYGYFVTTLDELAWITNCRGYHLPYQSVFKGRGLVTKDKVFVFVDANCPVSDKAQKESYIEFTQVDYPQIEGHLKSIQGKLNLEKVIFDSSRINGADYRLLERVFGIDKVQEGRGFVNKHQMIKDPTEIDQIEKSFARSEKAIFNTISWVQDQFQKNQPVSELDFYNKASEFYNKVGARCHSFHTIAGVGANSSIIHFGASSAEKIASANDLMLVDSGAYYEGGFATDCTRTFLAGGSKGKADEKQKEIYTLVLKGFLNVHLSVVQEGILGNAIDALARTPIINKGYDYAHGTGHGVGISVHEPGINFSPKSLLPVRPGQVVSVEPGIYIPGFGGVRIENVVVVEKHPLYSGKIRFRPIIFVGMDHNLINFDLLNNDEIKYLEDYESECQSRGTKF